MRKLLVPTLIGAAFCLTSLGSHAAVRVFDAAVLVSAGPNLVSLDGFGRGTAENRPESFAGRSAPQAGPGRETFFDTWNVQTGSVAPGIYSFTAMTVDVRGDLLFDSVALHSYDALGVRNTEVFTVNGAGTQAVGSGRFTVLASCPVASCIWIDVIGTQPIGSVVDGYGGTTVAVAVPEPAVWATMLLGLAGLRLATRRRRGSVAA